MSFNLTSLQAALPPAKAVPKVDDSLIIMGKPLQTLLSALDEGSVHLVGEGPDRSLAFALAVWRLWRGSTNPFNQLWASGNPWAQGDPEWDRPRRLTWLTFLATLSDGTKSHYHQMQDQAAENLRSNPLLGEVLDPKELPRKVIQLLYRYLRARHVEAYYAEDKRDFIAYQFNRQVDATDLFHAPKHLHAEIIWFQCPYPTSSKESPASLIAAFFTSAAEVQSKGDYLLLGLVASYLQSGQYRLKNVYTLGGRAYRFLGRIREIITPLLLFGYKHRGSRPEWNPHERIINEHDTWVFQRTDSES